MIRDIVSYSNEFYNSRYLAFLSYICAQVAAARQQGREGKIVLFEGDGGLLFHIQELETLKRQDLSHPDLR
jgi:thiamine pyrophosphate-dependent acetolactate synthase large subunit-like protein